MGFYIVHNDIINLDRSGFIMGLESDTIGGLNGMLEKQKKEKLL